MELFDKMKESITIAGQGVSQKAKSATESVRLSNMIKSNDRMIDKLTYQVGLQCVNNHINEPNTEYSALFSEILRLRTENQRLQAELKQATAVNSCPHCGFNNNANAKFCVSCGAPLFVVPAPAADARCCPKCGTANVNDAAFCVECGTPLSSAVPASNPSSNPSQVFQKTPAYESTSTVFKNYCPRCGFANTNDAMFCVECGSPIPQTAPVMNPSPVPAPGPTSEPIPVPTVDSFPESVSVPAPDSYFESAPASLSEQISEEASVPVLDTFSESLSTSASDPSPETISEPILEAFSESGCISDSEASPETSSGTAAARISLEKPETVKPADESAPVKNICKNCGAVLADDALFCTECGTKREL